MQGVRQGMKSINRDTQSIFSNYIEELISYERKSLKKKNTRLLKKFKKKKKKKKNQC